MKVGVDARLLSRPLTGIGRYTLEMCRALSRETKVTLYLYSPAPVVPDVMMSLEPASFRTGYWENGLLRQLWTESSLPLWAKRDGLDVFWGPAHRLPRLLPLSISRVVTIHDLVWKYAGETMRPLSRLLECYQMPAAIHAADEIVADSRATANAIKKEFFVQSNKLSIVPLGANFPQDIAPFEVLKDLGINQSYFLFVGTLEPRKNLTRLIRAYSYLSDSVKDQAVLVIAGDKGWGGLDINNMIADLRLDRYVHVLGYVDDSILATLYANALFLAMPSLYEGFGLPLVEAMVHGTPVLTSNNSSMPEVAGNAGLLVDPFDTYSIESGLEKLISNHDFRKILADNTRDHVNRFNWEIATNKLISIFERAIFNRTSQRA